jgi:hypothetical protein
VCPFPSHLQRPEIEMEQAGASVQSGGSMIERMKGAALLNIDTYEEVEADTTATGQAALVVALVAVAQTVGSAGMGISVMVMTMIGALLSWLIWAGITYIIGDKLLGGTATWGELLRTLGFAQTPRIFLILAGIPLIGWAISFVVGVWVLVAGIIAIRQACDFSTGKAILTAVLGWLTILILAVASWAIVGAPR